MAYLTTLPDFAPLEKLFSDNGYHITCDMANEILIFRNNDISEQEENFVEDYTIELSQELQSAIDDFIEINELY